MLSLLTSQITILYHFYLNDLAYQTGVMCLVVVFTIIVIIMNIEQLFDPMNIIRIDLEEEQYANLKAKVSKNDFGK